MTLKYENTAEIGDTIRAYDFEPMPGRRDRYVEGVVKAKGTVSYGYSAFTIEVTHDVAFPADDNRVGLDVHVPFESDMDYDGRVVNLDAFERDEVDHEANADLMVAALNAIAKVQENVPMTTAQVRALVDAKHAIGGELERYVELEYVEA